jgi:hypothetical protein
VIAAGLALSLAFAAAAPAEQAVVLVIGNNRSLDGGRPDLRYADDDALKYAAVFGSILSSPTVELLTRPDSESERLFPDAIITGPPTRDGVSAAVDRLASIVDRARVRARRTVLYLTFAGHGDQRKGKGYLELEDHELSGAALATLIDRIGADTTHLLLDSCNSYFVVHPRRPGGRVWSSATEGSAGPLAGRADIGVFLSTSAEAQVFEWSHLQSGIFSHAVRSGLSGAADQDLDGKVTYRELDAWVTVATGTFDNSLYQPHLFVSAPEDEVLADLSVAPGMKVTLEGFDTQVTVRDARGVRLLDVHPEQGFSPRLRLPRGRELSALSPVVTAAGRAQVRAASLREGALTPAALVAEAETPRGPSRLLEQMFSQPFGPRAFGAAAAARQRAPERVYGLSRELEAQLETHLEAMARQALYQRIAIGAAGAAVMLGGVGFFGASALVAALSPTGTPADLVLPAATAVGVAGVPALVLCAYALWPDKEERVLTAYREAPATSDQERAARLAIAIDDMVSYSDVARVSRWVLAAGIGGLGALLIGGAVTMALATLVVGSAPDTVAFFTLVSGASVGLGMSLVAVAAWVGFTPSDAELLADVARTATARSADDAAE